MGFVYLNRSLQVHTQPESPQSPNCILILLKSIIKKQFFSSTVDTKHILAFIPLICISSTENNPIIYRQVVTESIVLSQYGLCFTWSGTISGTLSAEEDSFYRSQWFISKVFGVWPDNTIRLTMMNRGFARIDTSHLHWRTQTYSPLQCLSP